MRRDMAKPPPDDAVERRMTTFLARPVPEPAFPRSPGRGRGDGAEVDGPVGCRRSGH